MYKITAFDRKLKSATLNVLVIDYRYSKDILVFPNIWREGMNSIAKTVSVFRCVPASIAFSPEIKGKNSVRRYWNIWS